MRTWPAIVVSALSRTHDAELLHGALAQYEIAAIEERPGDEWRVFFQDANEREWALIDLKSRFPHLHFATVDLADEDWAARSQADLRAIQVGRIIVAPPWDEPITLVIKPSTGFGTGHHATTRLCLAALQQLDLAGKGVLDVGTGSGVLAIAASRLGAEDVSGIDEDEDAVHAAWDNLALNPGAQVTLLVGDIRTTDLLPVDVILANLTGALLVQTAKRLRDLTKADGRLILSGFMVDEESEVIAAYGAFSVEHRGEEEGWVCVTLR